MIRRSYMKRSAFRAKPKKTAAEKTPRKRLVEMDFGDLVKILDNEFSYNLRAGTAAKQGHPFVACYTCGNSHAWNSGLIHCGHYIGREWYGTRWDTRNTRIQCKSCNSFHEGEKSKFGIHLQEDGVDLKALQLLADFQGKTHPAKESLIAWIKEYRKANAVIRKKLLGMDD